MEISKDFLATIVELAKIGGLGIGALIFLFVFILLLRNQPVDAETARLRTKFLYLGVAFAVLAVGVSLLQPGPQPGGAGTLVVTYSPKLGTAGLPTPEMILIDGAAPRTVEADRGLALGGSATLKISADELIAQARKVESAQAIAKTLVAANAVTAAPAVTGPAMPPAETATAAVPGPPSDIGGSVATGPAPATVVVSRSELGRIKALQNSAAVSLSRGDFVAAERTSANLQARLSRVAPGVVAPEN